MLFVAITSPTFIDGEAMLIRRLFDCGLDLLHLRKPLCRQGEDVTGVGPYKDAVSDEAALVAGCRRLLDQLPADILGRVVVHDYFDLALDYPLCGIHLTGRHPTPPAWLAEQLSNRISDSLARASNRIPDSLCKQRTHRDMTVSASCHSIAEVARLNGARLYQACSPDRPGLARIGPDMPLTLDFQLSYVFLSPVFNSISKEGYNAAFTVDELSRAAAEGIINGRVIALGGCSAVTIPLLRQWHFGGAALLGDVWRDTSAEHYALLRSLLR